ncbi:MAG TPA: flagellar hook capping FlgD N-terminal domain-containing protein [Phycisphaerales bacterium]|nr:flagellar hook capping FlgD N-terminal domain-containing protein [Phycisphaerales bacterium]
MAITSPVGVAGLAPEPRAAGSAFAELSSEQFVKIMFTELSKQDPLKPNDSAALLEQMASLRSIQSDVELSQRLDALVTQNQLAAASNLLGMLVAGLTEQGLRAEGLVVSVSRTPDGPVVNLDNGHRLPFATIDEMLDPGVLVTDRPGPGGS